jgi:hypothetical protein
MRVGPVSPMDIIDTYSVVATHPDAMAIAVCATERWPNNNCKAFQQINSEHLDHEVIANFKRHLKDAQDKLYQQCYEDIKRLQTRKNNNCKFLLQLASRHLAGYQ